MRDTGGVITARPPREPGAAAATRGEPTGSFTSIDGRPHYCIAAYHRMPPFLMNIPSATDLWMYVASSGGLTAGRRDPDGALFPYETVDRLLDAHHHTGPVTMVRVRRESGDVLWQPFLESADDDPVIERNLYKNTIGNRLTFEEIHLELELVFRYRWAMSDEFGVVRTAWLENRGRDRVRVSILDGLRNLLPFGAPLRMYQQSSCLVDAYKRVEYDPESRLAILSLTSRISDRPEPAEELRAATVFCHGLPSHDVCLSGDAPAAFRRGEGIPTTRVLNGQRGNYLATAALELDPGTVRSWHMAADTRRSQIDVARLRARLIDSSDTGREIEESLRLADERLMAIVGSADGLQKTNVETEDVHHFANVLFNNMRGGLFARNYEIGAGDLADFLQMRNRTAAGRSRFLADTLPATFTVNELQAAARRSGDADVERLCLEYLPLFFGRRHGDPSRPWNRFSIRVSNSAGRPLLHYEGNWRDIFQNWEALAASFPGFLPGMVARFVNASTVDGFNPYRVSREGIDWEVPDPDEPWSHIGYWGDHQVVYLLRLLEALRRTSPGVIEGLLVRPIFCYADVPYRLRRYEEMVADPRSTILFDDEKAVIIERRVQNFGSDGRLVHDADGRVRSVNLLEKLLVPALGKLSNLVPDAGIWMNTQRPEWNDANNALVGNGCSMVTLCQLRRYLEFIGSLMAEAEIVEAEVSQEVSEWFRGIASILEEKRGILSSPAVSDRDRREFLDGVGSAFSRYRDKVYRDGLTGRTALAPGEVAAFCRSAVEYLDHAVAANRRPDGLYHSYNLIEFSSGVISIRRLHEMLEGQVAVLSSGVMSATGAIELLGNLFASRIYCPDRKSLLLYPFRELPAYLEKNRIPDEAVVQVPLLRDLLAAGDSSIIEKDAAGACRFNSDFSNARDLSEALDRLSMTSHWSAAVERDRDAVLGVFETVFDHHSFTGRSGTMYAYEGLGCIYWHMVSKLLLAVQEIILKAAQTGEPDAVIDRLIDYYGRIRGGLGASRTVSEFGAFPADPYSHTRSFGGAQQPGMTGQVKEEILTRFGELGVQVEKGIVSFRPLLLGLGEFRTASGTFSFVDVNGVPRSIVIPAGGLAFTCCQVPIVYRVMDRGEIRVLDIGGATRTTPGDRLDAADSRAVLDRLGTIAQIEVSVPRGSLRV